MRPYAACRLYQESSSSSKEDSCSDVKTIRMPSTPKSRVLSARVSIRRADAICRTSESSRVLIAFLRHRPRAGEDELEDFRKSSRSVVLRVEACHLPRRSGIGGIIQHALHQRAHARRVGGGSAQQLAGSAALDRLHVDGLVHVPNDAQDRYAGGQRRLACPGASVADGEAGTPGHRFGGKEVCKESVGGPRSEVAAPARGHEDGHRQIRQSLERRREDLVTRER